MIEIRNVHKRFGATEAVADVSLTVGPGEVLCLLGANGAGKTTLINICLGFTSPDRGGVSICGHDVAQDPAAARARIGYIPEQALLYDALTAIEHVRFFSDLSGARLSDGQIAVTLDAAGLDADAARRRVGTYSKGMRQKVALAIALSKRAPVLLLDEPLSGLDPKSAIELSDRLRRLSQDERAVLLTTHDLFRALDTATHIGIMRSGRMQRIVATGSLAYADLERLYLETMAN
jgi:ABC-2 type transport system ATP-binding protein